MDDRGEKIINMAREMLRSGVVAPPSSTDNKFLSFKALCLATALAAFSGSAVTAWACETRRPLNHYEKTELNALIFYAARLKGINEDILRRDVEDTIGVGSFDDMTQSDFNAARHYLQSRAL